MFWTVTYTFELSSFSSSYRTKQAALKAIREYKELYPNGSCKSISIMRTHENYGPF